MRSIFVLLIVLTSSLVTGQNLSKTGVTSVSIRGAGAVIQDDQVKGYYYFYKVEKENRKEDNYLLSLVDENLRTIKEINITRPKNYVMVDAVFNGDSFCFLFFNAKGKSVELLAYDKTLKELKSMTKELKNQNQLLAYSSIAEAGGPSQAYIVPVTNKGFLYYGLKEGKKWQYEIEFYDSQMKLVWSEKAPETAKKVETASEGFQSGNYVGTLITSKSNPASRDIQDDLVVHEVATGKKLFRKPMLTNLYSIQLHDVYFDASKNTFTVFGEYFNKKDSELKAQSLGFITITLDQKGNITGEKLNSWATEISKVAPVDEKGKFDGNNARILFHDYVRTADGKIFAIGEQYKKAANAAGIIANVAFGPGVASNVQINVYHLVVFEFESDYSIKKVHVFEKDKNVVTLPAGAGSLAPKTLSYYARALGGFDFAFSQRSTDKETFYVSYVNYDREKGEKGKNILGTVVYTPEKTFTVDKVALNRKSSAYYVYRAKPGYVMVNEYFKKEKKLDTRLEKVNY